jgi:hypothetical protein
VNLVLAVKSVNARVDCHGNIMPDKSHPVCCADGRRPEGSLRIRRFEQFTRRCRQIEHVFASWCSTAGARAATLGRDAGILPVVLRPRTCHMRARTQSKPRSSAVTHRQCGSGPSCKVAGLPRPP